MTERGFIADCTDLSALDALMCSEAVPGYIGFDATATSLHVGSMVQIMMLRWLQKSGHKPIVLLGGGTTKLGDPSFRAEERPLLSKADIEKNICGISSVFSKFITFGNSPQGGLLANNADWLDKLNYLEFLRKIGRHFSVNRMLSFDSVKTRLDREQSLSFLEFNYMIVQAYDFMELNRIHGCRLQMGGSDQWGNIVNGVDLTRRAGGDRVFGLTSPLIETADGRKMGKTAAGAVWLNADMCSPYEYWQYWRNTADADVGRFLKLFTELGIDECDRLGSLQDRESNEAKIILANKATELAHGREAAEAAAATANRVFVEGGAGSELPAIVLARDSDFDSNGVPVVRALVRSRLARSAKEARRLIAGGGARVNGTRVQGTDQLISLAEFEGQKPVKLSAGRKRHALIELDR